MMNTRLIHCVATNETLLVIGGSFDQGSANTQDLSGCTHALLMENTTECRDFERNFRAGRKWKVLQAKTKQHGQLILSVFESEGSRAAIAVTNKPPMDTIVEDGSTVDKTSTLDYEFLWEPYIPLDDYSVLMAPGGVGKSFFAAGVIAAITSGTPLPGEDEQASTGRVALIVTAEEDSSQITSRVKYSGGNLDNLKIISRENSVFVNFDDDESLDQLRSLIKKYNAALVVFDPWISFIGNTVEINHAQSLRKTLTKVSMLAKDCHCAIVMISHTNKKRQDGNINNAALGSVDLINAARSALMIIFDGEEGNKNCRIAVHTKTNYADFGVSQRFRIVGSRHKAHLEWAGVSPITKKILEEAELKRKSPFEIANPQRETTSLQLETLVSYFKGALSTSVNGCKNMAYKELQDELGYAVFNYKQPKTFLTMILPRLQENGIGISNLGKHVRYKDGAHCGFTLFLHQPDPKLEKGEQLEIQNQLPYTE